MPLGAEKAGLFGASGVATGNYWGNGSDGALSTTGNVTHTVQNKNGSYDGDMVVKQYSSLTINTGQTMTVDQPCRGFLVYVKGDCIISGTLSMTRRGGLANPTSSGGSDSSTVSSTGIRLPMLKSGSTETLAAADFAGAGNAAIAAVANQTEIDGDGKIYTIARAGAAGAAAIATPACGYLNSPGGAAGNGGSSGSSSLPISSGGGGGGGGAYQYGAWPGTCGGGGQGGCFSGGAGGAGLAMRDYPPKTSGSGGNYGARGGNGASASGGGAHCGGSGNPSGTTNTSGWTTGQWTEAQDGVGGLLILLVRGDLTINSGGSVEAKGGDTSKANPSSSKVIGNGGGSGGGAVLILHAGSYTNNGSVSAAGGQNIETISSGCNSLGNGRGGAGGSGGTFVEQVDE